MVRISVSPATEDDALDLSARLRPSDLSCIQRVYRVTPIESLMAGVKAGRCWSGKAGAEVVAMWGVIIASLIGGIGYPWLVATPQLVLYKREFSLLYPGELQRMKTITPVLQTIVDPNSATAVRWARRAGFILKPTVYGPSREPVYFAELGG